MKVTLSSRMVAFESHMTAERPRDVPERRRWVVFYRRFLPRRFVATLQPHMSGQVEDRWTGEVVYRGGGEGIAEATLAYAEARNAAWRADIRYVDPE